MTSLTFAQPLWFIALALMPALAIFYFFAEKKSDARLGQMIAPKLRATLLHGVSRAKRLSRFSLTLLAVAALVTALARPQKGFETQEIKRKGRDVVVAIDTSRSMLADDVAPNRLSRAKLAVQDLLRILEGDRVALVAFAGTAFLQAPLTIDYGAVQDSLEQIDTSIIPKGGTDIAAAIRVGIEAFGKAEGANKALIIFTDGEELSEDGVNAATAAKEAGIRVFTVGVGSSAGTMIPIQEDGVSTFVRDDVGQFVKTKLDEARLKEIAAAGDGFYVHLENGSDAVQTLLNQGIRKLEEREGNQMLSRRPIERYQWPLGLAIVFFILAQSLGDRRRSTVSRAAVASVLFFLVNATAHAEWTLPFSDQEKRSYNDGREAYKAGKGEKLDNALKKFSDASTSTDPDVRKKAEYNAANTLFQIGAQKLEGNRKEAIEHWKEAISHYDEALKVDKDFADARYNRDLVEKLLKEDEKKKQEQDKRDEDEKKKNQDQQQQQNQAKNDQQKDDQKQQQQKKDDQQKQQPGKDGKNQPDQAPQSGKNQQQPGNGQKNQGQAEPTPTPGEKKEGEVKAADSGEKKDQPKEGQDAPTAENAEEEKDGKMSKEQARALIEAMQSEEQRVNLRDRMSEQRVAKDW